MLVWDSVMLMAQETKWSVAINPQERSARLVGEFDASNAAVIDEVLATISRPEPEVRVDAADVTFCSSAMLTVLIDARARFAGQGATLTVEPVSGVVQRLLSITDTTSLFQVAP